MTFEDLKAQALRLDLKERARLARDLLSSLEEPGDEEILALWDEEARHREAEIERDPAILVDGEEVRTEALARFPPR